MRKAFTMLEFVFVIVVIGILTATIVSNRKASPLREAATQLVSDIRYTQHLAMVDDKFDSNDGTWFKKRWQLLFGHSADTGGYYAYSIFSDSSKTGNPDPGEMAVNPLNRAKLLSGGFSGTLNWEDTRATKALNIGYKYSVDNITQSGCGAKRISFDHMGRPLQGNSKNWTSPISGVLTSQCNFTLHHGTESLTIAIEPETGYTHIL